MRNHGLPLLAACTLVSAMALGLWPAGRAEARGTPAGTDIVTRASVTYAMDGQARSGASNEISVRVDEVVDFAVVWQDAARWRPSPATARAPWPTCCRTPATAASATCWPPCRPWPATTSIPAAPASTWTATATAASTRRWTRPTSGASTTRCCRPDQATLVFLAADIPPDAADGSTGTVKLVVTAGTGVGAPGTVVVGAGDGGTNAVLGGSGGFGERTGVYAVIAVLLTVAKRAEVADPDGGADPRPGAVITYTIVATVAGAGTARGVVITDPLPPHTAYRPDSLRLNGLALTDGDDGDAGDFGASLPGTLTVRLGDLTADSAPQEVAFQVTIP